MYTTVVTLPFNMRDFPPLQPSKKGDLLFDPKGSVPCMRISADVYDTRTDLFLCLAINERPLMSGRTMGQTSNKLFGHKLCAGMFIVSEHVLINYPHMNTVPEMPRNGLDVTKALEASWNTHKASEPFHGWDPVRNFFSADPFSAFLRDVAPAPAAYSVDYSYPVSPTYFPTSPAYVPPSEPVQAVVAGALVAEGEAKPLFAPDESDVHPAGDASYSYAAVTREVEGEGEEAVVTTGTVSGAGEQQSEVPLTGDVEMGGEEAEPQQAPVVTGGAAVEEEEEEQEQPLVVTGKAAVEGAKGGVAVTPLRRSTRQKTQYKPY